MDANKTRYSTETKVPLAELPYSPASSSSSMCSQKARRADALMPGAPYARLEVKAGARGGRGAKFEIGVNLRVK